MIFCLIDAIMLVNNRSNKVSSGIIRWGKPGTKFVRRTEQVIVRGRADHNWWKMTEDGTSHRRYAEVKGLELQGEGPHVGVGKGSVRTGQSCSWEHQKKKKFCSSCTVWNNFKPSKCSCLSQTEIIHFAQIGFYRKTFSTSVYHLSDTLAEEDQNTHFKVKVRTFLYSDNVLSGPCNVTEAVILVQTWCGS